MTVLILYDGGLCVSVTNIWKFTNLEAAVYALDVAIGWSTPLDARAVKVVR